MKENSTLEVRYEDRSVGTLALTVDHRVAFSYSDEWLKTGFSIKSIFFTIGKQGVYSKEGLF